MGRNASVVLSIDMGLLDWVAERTADLGRDIADSGHAAVYLRQLLRGSRAPTAHGGEVHRHRAAPAPDTPPGPPVLLINGYLSNRGSLHLLERRLHERHHTVLTYRLPRMNLGDIRDTAALIARKVE